jgi:nucleotide-binding universal stress UspA family protein
MVQLQEVSSGGVARSTFSRLLVVFDDSDEGRRAVEFANDWAQAVGAQVRLLELPGNGAAGARNRTAVAAVVDAAAEFGADVMVLGCRKRRLANHRRGLSLRERLARATDLPLMVPSPDRHGRGQDDHERMDRARVDHGSRSGAVARV